MVSWSLKGKVKMLETNSMESFWIIVILMPGKLLLALENKGESNCVIYTLDPTNIGNRSLYSFWSLNNLGKESQQIRSEKIEKKVFLWIHFRFLGSKSFLKNFKFTSLINTKIKKYRLFNFLKLR